jgi:endonuclease G, mitochondrial
VNFRYLLPDEITELVEAALAAGLAGDAVRNILKAALNQGFALGSLVDNVGQPQLQLYADLNTMNFVERLADGTVPLRDWLRIAGSLARGRGRTEANIFTKYEAIVEAKASGQPALPDPQTLREVMNNEHIVHQNDMLDFWYLSAGILAGASVAKLLVPRYENGAPVLDALGKPIYFDGTGWLLTDQLIMTNKHVVEARKRGENPPSDADLLLQGANTQIQFGYDTEDVAPPAVPTAKLEAWDTDLDFAILRLAAAATHKPLRLRNQSVVFSDGIYVPLNIIQHPGANAPKKIAIRNNLLTAADQTTIRYFTDTLPGSSGSPVFDDAWRVIALHRGSVSVQGVSFQGQSVAVVNVGTQINAILKHLELHSTQLRNEITV